VLRPHTDPNSPRSRKTACTSSAIARWRSPTLDRRNAARRRGQRAARAPLRRPSNGHKSGKTRLIWTVSPYHESAAELLTGMARAEATARWHGPERTPRRVDTAPSGRHGSLARPRADATARREYRICTGQPYAAVGEAAGTAAAIGPDVNQRNRKTRKSVIKGGGPEREVPTHHLRHQDSRDCRLKSRAKVPSAAARRTRHGARRTFGHATRKLSL
jgi:hypothetical protein